MKTDKCTICKKEMGRVFLKIHRGICPDCAKKMKVIKVKDGYIQIPKDYQISETKRRLHVKTSWMSEIQTYPKNAFNVTKRCHFRSKDQGDKPFVPEGFVEVDKELFRLVEA